MTTTETVTPDSTWCPARPLGRELPLDDAERADIARWVVAMYRAHAAETEQTTGNLRDDTGHCCLGLWCEIATARGVLAVRTNALHDNHVQEWVGLGESDGPDHGWQSGALPEAAYLGGLDDPEVMSFASREVYGDSPAELQFASEDDGDWTMVSAAGLNDDHGLTFAQIADLVVWSYAVTAEELAAASSAPRVGAIEGEAN